ncbi:MAG: hypothetical protein DI528_04170 [Shinella sp.]|nr:MAG: hypothetical protein DI528_04170 [Shinella sp.]
MKQERLIENLREMEQVALETAEFMSSLSREAFNSNLVLQRALGMNLLMIGEVANRLVDDHGDFVADHPEIPWMKIRGMRNGIAHNYFRIDLDTVWNTSALAIPELLTQLRALRSTHPQGE